MWLRCWGGNPNIEIPRHGCHDVLGYFYVRYGIQKTPGEMTNNLAGVGENAYSRDAPTSLRHVYRTTGTILIS